MSQFDTLKNLSDNEFEMRKNLKTKEMKDKLAVIYKSFLKMTENEKDFFIKYDRAESKFNEESKV